MLTSHRFTRAIAGLGLCTIVGVSLVAHAQQPRPRQDLREPVYRVSNARVEQPQREAHPLDAAIDVATQSLEHFRATVKDYSCTLVKRERIRGELSDPLYMYTEIRNQQTQNGQMVVPFGVYMYFLKPSSVKGREVIYVNGRNNNKMVAHEGGNLGRLVPAVWLRPDGPLAMKDNLYPITDVGIENLITKLIEKGERDRKRGEVDVKFIKNAKINGRTCTVLQVTHPEPRPYFDFHIARIFIDDELNMPVRYAAYSWPKQAGGPPVLLEEYTYLNLKLNVGLEDKDFDHKKKFRS